MEKPISYHGEWWIPGKEHRWPGRFSYAPETGARLEVDAKLDDGLFPPPENGISILFGEATDKTAITLVDLIQTQTKSHLFAGGVEATFVPNQAFLGAWFNSSDDLIFEKLEMRVSNVDNWLNVSGFQLDYRSRQSGFSLDYSVPESLQIGEIDGIQVFADFHADGLSLTQPLIDIEVHQRAWLRLELNAPRRFEDLFEIAAEIRDFFSFVTRHTARILDMTASTTIDVSVPNGATESQSKEIAVLFPPDTATADPEPVHQPDMLFRHGEGRDGADNPLSQWLSKRESLGPIYGLYLAGLYRPHTYLDLQFLSLTQALESLHGRKCPHYELPREQHRERVATILRSVDDEELRSWLNEKLATSNKASFRQGLADLLNTLPPTLKRTIGDTDQFTQLVGWTRNYYTHRDPELEQKAARGRTLLRLTWGLRLIAEALLLLELGFSVDDVEGIVDRNHRVKNDLKFAFIDE